MGRPFLFAPPQARVAFATHPVCRLKKPKEKILFIAAAVRKNGNNNAKEYPEAQAQPCSIKTQSVALSWLHFPVRC